MNRIRISAVARKEFIQILRDPRSLTLAIILPVLLVWLFGYALSLDIDHVPVVMWDQDHTDTSLDFIMNFQCSTYFNIIGRFDSYAPMIRSIDKCKAYFAMVIPKDFSHLIQSNGTAPVQFLLDGSDSNTAMIVRGYISSVITTYNRNVILNALKQAGIRTPPRIEGVPRIWFNQDIQSKNFIIPGLISMVLMIIAALLTSLTVAKEWERGTMEQLISTPVKGGELIIGKFLPYFVIGFVDLLIVIAMGQFVFRVPFRGNLFLLLFLSCFFLTGVLMMGIFISATSRNQRAASQVAMLATFLPSYLLSGFMFPIFNMPQAVQWITYLVPARYFIVVLRGIYLKGVGISDLWTQAVFLTVFASAMGFLALKSFKKKVA